MVPSVADVVNRSTLIDRILAGFREVKLATGAQGFGFSLRGDSPVIIVDVVRGLAFPIDAPEEYY